MLDLNADVKVSRDAKGIIRQLSHTNALDASVQSSFGFAQPTAAPTPRQVAEEYLRQAAPILGFGQSEVANFAASTENTPSAVGVELRFKEEKSVGESVTVAYDQTVAGLPIWNAGVSVRMDGRKMGVTGMHNAAHYGVNVHIPSKDAAFVPHAMQPEVVAQLHNIPAAQLTVNSTRLLVYFFDAEQRLDPQIESHKHPEDEGLNDAHADDFPVLPVPSLQEGINDLQHYVVTEVLFSYPYDDWGMLNWRSFIEPDTGAVLYLRALVSCARGAVFLTDPVSATGILHSAATPVAELDAIRNTVSLFGLNEVIPAGSTQQLEGQYVKLKNIELPNIDMPTENPPYDFFYSADTAKFAACNAYHHCDGFFRMLQGMGIDVNTYFNNTNFPVPVDPHALNGRVNAMAPGNVAGNGLDRLVFGVVRQGSNLGISADARVVLHEFGHAVLWDHVNYPNFGFAHSPGDSFAAILHDPESRHTDRFETFPFMKSSNVLSRRHDRRVEDGWGWFGRHWDEGYGGEQVLSTTLFRVYQAAGGDSEDPAERKFASRYVCYLILKAVGLLSFTTDNPDIFVAALTEADNSTALFEGHPGGAFSKVFRWSFEMQGLYQPNAGDVTSAGAPPDIDVYIDDGRQGHYMNYQNDFTNAPGIWNRNSSDGQTENENLQPGATNFAYVRISNRGTMPVTSATVRAFQSRTDRPINWPADWQPMQTPVLALQGLLTPGESVIAGPFKWVPQTAKDHMLFSVSAPGDRSNIELINAGPILNKRLVLLDNNIAQKAFV